MIFLFVCLVVFRADEQTGSEMKGVGGCIKSQIVTTEYMFVFILCTVCVCV